MPRRVNGRKDSHLVHLLQELEAKAVRNTERLAANRDKMVALVEQRRAKLEEKTVAAEEKRLQIEAVKAKEREALQQKAQQVPEEGAEGDGLRTTEWKRI